MLAVDRGLSIRTLLSALLLKLNSAKRRMFRRKSSRSPEGERPIVSHG
jgi:hypothetical protein